MNKTSEYLGLLKSLRALLSERFNTEELQTICFEMGIEYEDLGGQGKAGKARELVSYIDRRDLILELISVGERLRPDILWGKMVVPSSLVLPLGNSPAKTERVANQPARILFLAANPTGTSPLRLSEEIRDIDHALRLTKFRDRFDIEQQWAVRISDLQEHFMRFRPSIVHFSGHGNDVGEIILESHTGTRQPVSARALSNLFRTLRDNIKCVVLNACYSEVQARAIAEYIDCVIGMNKAVSDQAAINFASAFYRALGYGRDVKTAFDLGVGQIDLAGLEEQNTPKLITLRHRPEEIVLVKDIDTKDL